MNDVDIEHLRSAISIVWQARGMATIPSALCSWTPITVSFWKRRTPSSLSVTARATPKPTLVRLATQRFSPEQLARCTLYSSTEPCAMCAGAIHWSRIGRVVFALSEIDLYAIIGPSPEHLLLPCRGRLRTVNVLSQ